MQHAVERSGHVRVGADVVADELELLVSHEVRDVVRRPGDEVVEPDDLVTVGQKAIAQMGAEEARGAGDQHSHDVTLPTELYVKPMARIFAGS